MTALSKSQPYPGLRPFEDGDEAFFFGRDSQRQGLRDKLRTSRLVAVVGRSGCGKSSLVKAGLVPLLRGEIDADRQPIWHIASLRPRGQPISELTAELQRLTALLQPVDTGGDPPQAEADTGDRKFTAFALPALSPDAMMAELRRARIDAALRRSSLGLVEIAGELDLPEQAKLLVIVDQFEEIFRFEDPTGRNADEATAFVRLLMEAINAGSPTIHVILTMRLDFLGDCARFARLPEAISDGQYLVPNLSRAERRAAIERPALASGKTVRPEVTQRLLNEIGEDPDQLPVLQHVLMRMWQHAGDNKEITLRDYTETGGVKEAISRHANQLYDKLSSEEQAVATRLFKANSERDRRGRSIRRLATFGEIAGIVAQDNPNVSEKECRARLVRVIDAYRAPDCCFLMPTAGDPLHDLTPIDISHESLLRGWVKLTGAGDQEGWIAEEDRDGRAYRGLLEAFENDYKLPMRNAAARRKWWDKAKPNKAWADRYGNKFAEVEQFVRTSNTRAFVTRFLILALIVVAAISTVGLAGYWSYSEVQESALRDAKQQVKLREEQLQQAQKKILEQQARLDQLGSSLTSTIRQAQTTLSQSGDQKASQELDSLLKKSGSYLPDNAVQRPVVDPSNSITTLSTDTGYMWLGPAQGGNLVTPSGEPLLPTQPRINGQYLTTQDIFLRQALPDRTSYAQAPQIGIMPEGTRVQLLNVEPPFSRTTGDQYWARVRVVKLALSTVYFQFAGGSREQAQQISRALQDKGYKIPSEERSSAAAGKREVRFFYAGQTALAQELAKTTNQVLQQLGYGPQLQVTAVQTTTSSKGNPDGKLELWLEIPPR